MSLRRDSNSVPQTYQVCALPIELRRRDLELTNAFNTIQCLKHPQLQFCIRYCTVHTPNSDFLLYVPFPCGGIWTILPNLSLEISNTFDQCSTTASGSLSLKQTIEKRSFSFLTPQMTVKNFIKTSNRVESVFATRTECRDRLSPSPQYMPSPKPYNCVSLCVRISLIAKGLPAGFHFRYTASLLLRRATFPFCIQ